MHEHSLISGLIHKIEHVAAQEHSDRVVGVHVKLGALSHISAEHFREHFEHAAVGTVAEGAVLGIEVLEDLRDPHAQEIMLDRVELAVPRVSSR